MSGELDQRVRLAAFQWLRAQMDVHGEVLPRAILAEGFVLDGRRVPFLGPQGIFKPAVCEMPLSITTSPNSPYSDSWTPDNRLRYGFGEQIPGISTIAAFGVPCRPRRRWSTSSESGPDSTS